MLFYRYAGMADGSFNWAVEQKVIGTGWNVSVVAAGGAAGAVVAPAPAPAPASQQPVFSNEKCFNYARGAVNDFKEANGIPNCSKMVKQQDPSRWHDQLPRHYNWCLTAQQAWLRAETSARDKLLLDCGVRKNL
jgi:hypothetical protein